MSVLESVVEGDFLVADDPRTTEALKGYVLQTVDYVETGERSVTWSRVGSRTRTDSREW